MVLINKPDGARDVRAGAFALHASRRKKNMNGAGTTRYDIKDVADCSAGGRSDDAYAPGENRQRALDLLREKPFGLQSIPHLLKSNLQRAGAHRIESFDN